MRASQGLDGRVQYFRAFGFRCPPQLFELAGKLRGLTVARGAAEGVASSLLAGGSFSEASKAEIGSGASEKTQPAAAQAVGVENLDVHFR